MLLHELGHAFAATALTDGDVEIDLRGAGVLGGRVHYEPARLRRPRDEVWIAAAGPAISLLIAAALGIAWIETGAESMMLGVGAFGATLQFALSALPLRYGAGLGVGESDGRVIWRVLRGAPPGGLERELRRMGEPERAARPGFVVVLVAVGALAFWLDTSVAVALVALFGLAILLQKLD